MEAPSRDPSHGALFSCSLVAQTAACRDKERGYQYLPQSQWCSIIKRLLVLTIISTTGKPQN
jgi:hypothetical protein